MKSWCSGAVLWGVVLCASMLALACASGPQRTVMEPKELSKKEANGKSAKDAEAAREEAKEEVLQKSALLLALIGTGEGGGEGEVVDVFADGEGFADLDAALEDVDGVAVTDGDGVNRGGGAAGGDGVGVVGSLGNVAVVEPAPEVNVRVVLEAIEITDGPQDSLDALRQGVRRRFLGRLSHCYKEAHAAGADGLPSDVEVHIDLDAGGLVVGLSFSGQGFGALDACVEESIVHARLLGDDAPAQSFKVKVRFDVTP